MIEKNFRKYAETFPRPPKTSPLTAVTCPRSFF